ncbi:MAG: hypothetical protein H0W15_13160 [Gemmatimonadales bacterium]|nr:hypothetical protein [Gemmatimonadales bacterium]
MSSFARLGALRAEILASHRALLDAERLAYERLFGRIPGSTELLQLAIHDPWFGWLRPLTALIAAMDELAVDEEPDDLAVRVEQFRGSARDLMQPDENGTEFQQRYFELVQKSPDVALAHGRLSRLLDDVR